MIINSKKMEYRSNADQKCFKSANNENSALVTQNNRPEYILPKINNTQKYEVADNNELDAISKKLIQQNMDACKKLANGTCRMAVVCILSLFHFLPLQMYEILFTLLFTVHIHAGKHS